MKNFQREPVSVCMATFNGDKYVLRQIMSILTELKSSDEIIIVDDASNDQTVRVIQDIQDNRISLHQNNFNHGVNYSFARALSLARNRYVFLADQDDLWLEGRVDKMLVALHVHGALLVTSNSFYIDETGHPVHHKVRRKHALESDNHLGNILRIILGRGNYPGCAMALDIKLLRVALPFPDYIESHDLWIAMCANLMKANYHLEDETLARVLHGGNLSLVKRPWLKRSWSRVIFLRSWLELWYRLHFEYASQ